MKLKSVLMALLLSVAIIGCGKSVHLDELAGTWQLDALEVTDAAGTVTKDTYNENTSAIVKFDAKSIRVLAEAISAKNPVVTLGEFDGRLYSTKEKGDNDNAKLILMDNTRTVIQTADITRLNKDKLVITLFNEITNVKRKMTFTRIEDKAGEELADKRP